MPVSSALYSYLEKSLSNPVLVLAGINNSGPTHWQTLWEEKYPNFSRLEHRDWDHPICSEWVADIENAVRVLGPNTVLVAHSLACLSVAHWAAKSTHPIKAAMLVSVPDPSGAAFPNEATGFGNVPNHRFNFPSIVVASTNDPFGSVDYMNECAIAWGSRFFKLGAYGHINSSSGLGDWIEGYNIFLSLVD